MVIDDDNGEQRTGIEQQPQCGGVAGLPAQATNAPVERVTVASRPSKDPKKVAAGRAGAAARNAKRERLLEGIRAAKESFRVPEERNGTSPKDANNTSKHVAVVVPKEHNNQNVTNWTPWIVGLTGGAVASLRALPAKKSTQTTDVPPQSRTCFYSQAARSPWSDGEATTTMTTPATDGKMLVNALFHSAVVSGIAMGYSRLCKMAMGVAPRSLTLLPVTWEWPLQTSLSPWRPRTC